MADQDVLTCEVRDTGNGFADGPAVEAGDHPNVSTPGGLGIWLAGQLVDSLHVVSGATGATVRIRTRLPSR